MDASGFDRESTLDLIGLSHDVPTLPDRFVRIQRIIDNPHSGIDDLAEAIHTDQATCAMILKVANSAAYNPSGRPTSTLRQALSRLGSREVSHIALTMSLMFGFALPMGMAHVRAFWIHAFGTAIIAEQLALRVGYKDGREAFMAGLLHDIGRAMIGLRVDLAYFESPLVHLHGDELVAAEREHYGLDHAEAGMHTLTLWHFPPKLIRAVAEHHQADSTDTLARIIRTACQLSNEHIPNGAHIEGIPPLLHEAMSDILTPERISEFTSALAIPASH
jgi:putative nucleotidyltransferase with HDIG domain